MMLLIINSLFIEFYQIQIMLLKIDQSDEYLWKVVYIFDMNYYEIFLYNSLIFSPRPTFKSVLYTYPEVRANSDLNRTQWTC